MSAAAVSYHPSPSAPRRKLPPLACDTHVHVFGPQSRFAFTPERAYTTCDAPKERLFALHGYLGIERCVVVQSKVHGYDNSASADAIAAKDGAYVGVALVPVDVPGDELKRLDRAGFCGARFHFARHLGTPTPIAEVIAFAASLAELGRHLQLNFESAVIHVLAPAIGRSPVPVVIDHMGRIEASLGIDQPDFRKLRDVLADERVWVKVSGSERVSRQGPPYADAVPFGRALVQDAPSRVLWGTDWPHPNLDHVPDDGLLADLIEQFAPTDAERQALLVDNPARLYRFGERR
jgi:2-pyrone-4,6-dicarboxylate lactonase